jgi:hypothetical protein
MHGASSALLSGRHDRTSGVVHSRQVLSLLLMLKQKQASQNSSSCNNSAHAASGQHLHVATCPV